MVKDIQQATTQGYKSKAAKPPPKISLRGPTHTQMHPNTQPPPHPTHTLSPNTPEQQTPPPLTGRAADGVRGAVRQAPRRQDTPRRERGRLREVCKTLPNSTVRIYVYIRICIHICVYIYIFLLICMSMSSLVWLGCVGESDDGWLAWPVNRLVRAMLTPLCLMFGV